MPHTIIAFHNFLLEHLSPILNFIPIQRIILFDLLTLILQGRLQLKHIPIDPLLHLKLIRLNLRMRILHHLMLTILQLPHHLTNILKFLPQLII